ncbi:MAG: hypothetical protein FWG30_04625 [Eubacteriaceae bacterium]|nr:hypothetical protein [Eubacteriaceae bacterium]
MDKYSIKYGYEYSINELFHELLEDDSWEPDPVLRERIVRAIWSSVCNRQPMKKAEE